MLWPFNLRGIRCVGASTEVTHYSSISISKTSFLLGTRDVRVQTRRPVIMNPSIILSFTAVPPGKFGDGYLKTDFDRVLVTYLPFAIHYNQSFDAT
jgi:hypothetical protein